MLPNKAVKYSSQCSPTTTTKQQQQQQQTTLPAVTPPHSIDAVAPVVVDPTTTTNAVVNQRPRSTDDGDELTACFGNVVGSMNPSLPPPFVPAVTPPPAVAAKNTQDCLSPGVATIANRLPGFHALKCNGDGNYKECYDHSQKADGSHTGSAYDLIVALQSKLRRCQQLPFEDLKEQACQTQDSPLLHKDWRRRCVQNKYACIPNPVLGYPHYRFVVAQCRQCGSQLPIDILQDTPDRIMNVLLHWNESPCAAQSGTGCRMWFVMLECYGDLAVGAPEQHQQQQKEDPEKCNASFSDNSSNNSNDAPSTEATVTAPAALSGVATDNDVAMAPTTEGTAFTPTNTTTAPAAVPPAASFAPTVTNRSPKQRSRMAERLDDRYWLRRQQPAPTPANYQPMDNHSLHGQCDSTNTPN